MSDLISRSALLNTFNNTGIQITFDLPVEEILGEDVDIDDFTMLLQDAIQAYKKMVIDTIKNQPTAYDADKVVAELGNKSFKAMNYPDSVVDLNEAIEIVKSGGVCEGCIEAWNCPVRDDCPNMPSDDVCEWKYKHPFGDFPSCRVVNSISRDRNWEYCPYCGKKIKVVDKNVDD